MADTKKTKSFDSGMVGASALSGTAGALIAILNDVLVTGFGLQTASSVVVASGIATATFATAHPYRVDTVALIAGATPSGLNGEKRILAVVSDKIVTFDATGITDGTATGTITSKVAPAGWTKVFTGTNLAAYKSASVEGTGCYLRVDDTGTTVARVRGYETMSDVNTGTGPFPTVAQFAASGLWWSKSNAASGAVRPWRIVADDRGVYFFPKPADTTYENQGNYFGDFLSLKSGDPYACLLRANSADRSAAVGGSFGDDLLMADGAQAYDGAYVTRAANTLGGAQKVATTPVMTVGLANAHVTGSVGMGYPLAADNGLMLTPAMVHGAQGARGYMPGIFYSPQIVNTAFSTGDVVPGSGDMAGKKVMAVRLGNLVTTPAQCGMVFVDITSDWR